MKAYRAVKRLLGRERRPTALIASNHDMTVGALMALNELKVMIPDELSLIGFGDYGLSLVTRPSLTVIDKPTAAIGRKAAELLIRRMEGDYTDYPKLIKLKAKLILKDSVKRI
jgi:LacI family transcriptional regulator